VNIKKLKTSVQSSHFEQIEQVFSLPEHREEIDWQQRNEIKDESRL